VGKNICAAIIYDGKMYVGSSHVEIWERIKGLYKNVSSSVSFDGQNRGYLNDSGVFSRRRVYTNYAVFISPRDMNVGLGQQFADKYNAKKAVAPSFGREGDIRDEAAEIRNFVNSAHVKE
jgi:hypothetical protein